MNCRFIPRMQCREDKEELTTDTHCQVCLIAHMSNQLDKLIKMGNNRHARV